MHIIQEKILKLVSEQNVGNLKLRELGDLIGVPHPQLIKHHLNQLEQKGFIIINRAKKIISRADQLAESSFKSIPILGSADCGPANFFADQNVEGYLKVSDDLLKSKNNLFALRAVGQSMNRSDINGKSIEDGDYVIIEFENMEIKNKDYVVSIIDGVCNIKKLLFDKDNNQVVLMSESTKNFPPIFINPETTNYFVNGKVVQVIKAPKNN